ncbi:hypothetical protein [Sphingobium algorifonticola]|uniref:Uncharacterized protein n=1 Tax=Sphingobium algorifonticola TaxID=2008318 RepID=A0A437JBR8_9SPHN|nr:hypothetical protein [Sphingobium algorifonticola]RVT43314.1 hypothetical protein ENE74_01385 [Sphingobium algorifonticola]
MTRLYTRRPILALVTATALAAQPAQAQFFFSPPDLSSPPVTGAEPTLGLNMPGATQAELDAGLVWNLRAALNVAALQCDFEPTLLTVSNYNAMIAHHSKELAQSFATLGAYFQRTVGKGKPGQAALDQYGTRIYSGYSTVQAQRNFCQTASSIGRDAIFMPRGQLVDVARKRMGELKKSLVLSGERYFGSPGYNYSAVLPPLTEECWKKGKLMASCKARWDAEAAKKPAG